MDESKDEGIGSAWVTDKSNKRVMANLFSSSKFD
jgi:hypothetical protein